MILFSICLLAYVGVLLFARPARSSLKAPPYTFTENLRLIKASLVSGVVVLAVYLVTTDLSFFEVNPQIYNEFALYSDFTSPQFRPVQLFTHVFLHGDLVHVLANVIGLALASAYERRVGSGRFLAVLMVGIAASIPSFLFYAEPVRIVGLSGGIFGVAAAYFTDDSEAQLKDWLKMVLLVAFIMFLIAVDSEYQSSPTRDMSIDHIGHALGALGGIVYCRLLPIRTSFTEAHCSARQK